MSLRQWFARRFSNRGEVAASPPATFLRHPWLHEAGVHINAETAVQVAAVYGCCRLIVDCLAPAPVTVFEVQSGGKREEQADDPVGWVLNYGAPVAKAPDAPTSQAIEEALYWSALLHGNGYAEIQRDASGRLFALWPLEPERVTPRYDDAGYYYEVRQYQGGTVRVPAVDMFHLRGPSLYGWVGDSAVYRAAKAIGIAHAAQVFSAAYFANGTVVSGLLTSDKAITPQQAEAAKAKWTEIHGGGPANSNGLAVLGQGLKYQPISHTAQEAMLVDARRFQVQEIARFFGVPCTLLADNEAWTNLGELYLGFFRNALKPWAERYDAEATRKLFPQRQPWREVSHDLTHLTLGSFKDQVSALVQATGRPIWTVNEARDVFGLNSMPGGDKLEEPKPAPAPQPRAEPDEPQEDPAPVKTRPTTRNASVAQVAVALDRFQRKITARKADLEKNAPEKAEANLAALRAKAEADLAAECERAVGVPVDVARVAAAVLEGEPAHLAAERLLPTA